MLRWLDVSGAGHQISTAVTFMKDRTERLVFDACCGANMPALVTTLAGWEYAQRMWIVRDLKSYGWQVDAN
ncbi:MAG: hypothetical protein U0521_15630 [Anaerolineae bacterium]